MHKGTTPSPHCESRTKHLLLQHIITRYTELDEVIFDEDHNYLDLQAVKMFDRIDFVFLAGSDKILPWAASNLKLLILLVSNSLKLALL